MYSCATTDSAIPRVTRAMRGRYTTLRAMMMLRVPVPRAAATATARSRGGKDMRRSMLRMITPDTREEAIPAKIPSPTPGMPAASMVRTEVMRLTRAP